MAKQGDRNWNKGRPRLWSRDRNCSGPPSHPPPPPRTPAAPLFISRDAAGPSSYPPDPPPSSPCQFRSEERLAKWPTLCERHAPEPCPRSNPKDTRGPERQRVAAAAAAAATVTWMHRTRGRRDTKDQTVVVVGGAECSEPEPEQQAFQEEEPEHYERERKKDDRLRRFVAHIREKISERMPPPPPRFDFPIECRSPKKAEDEPTRKEAQGSYRQPLDAIEIFPDRKCKRQPSDLNLVPTQAPDSDDNRVDEYAPYCERGGVKAGAENADEYSRRRGETRRRERKYGGNSFLVTMQRDSLRNVEGRGSPCGGGRDYKERDASSDDMRECEERWRPPPGTGRDDRGERRDAIEERPHEGHMETDWFFRRDVDKSESDIVGRSCADMDLTRVDQGTYDAGEMRGFVTEGCERRKDRDYDARVCREGYAAAYDRRDVQERAPVARNAPVDDLRFHALDEGRIHLDGRRPMAEDRRSHTVDRGRAVGDEVQSYLGDRWRTMGHDLRAGFADRLDLRSRATDRRDTLADDQASHSVDKRGAVDHEMRSQYMDRRGRVVDDVTISADKRGTTIDELRFHTVEGRGSTTQDRTNTLDRRDTVVDDQRTHSVHKWGTMDDDLRPQYVDRLERITEKVQSHDKRGSVTHVTERRSSTTQNIKSNPAEKRETAPEEPRPQKVDSQTSGTHFRERPTEKYLLTYDGKDASVGTRASKDDGQYPKADIRERSVQTEATHLKTVDRASSAMDKLSHLEDATSERLLFAADIAEHGLTTKETRSVNITDSMGFIKKARDKRRLAKDNWKSGTSEEDRSFHSDGKRYPRSDRSRSEAANGSCDSEKGPSGRPARKGSGGGKSGRPQKTDTVRKRSGDVCRMSDKSHPYERLREEDYDVPVEKVESVLLPVLEDAEKEFHGLVAAGDVAAVRHFLTQHPGFNINCVNYQQISALHVAVHEQNEAMVEFLLEQPSLECSDCVLYSIKEGNVRIVEKIMDKIRETCPGLEYAATTHSVDFPDDMTPIILAAQLGNYEIIDFLIKREHVIPPVHNPYCKCDACKGDLQKYDRLKYSTMKLNLYKAICNPMYIFHVTDDPFQRAFDLTQELQDAARVFPQFKSSYEELWKELRNFTVDLIGCCRNAQEVEIILKKSATNIAGSITFPRLQYAIDLKQKEFVSHPYTQAVLVDAWTGDLLEWKVRSPMMQALSVFPRIPMLPIMAVMCMLLPNHKLVRKWKTPVNKMISSVASYLIFLIILFLESNLDKTNQKRGPPNSGLEGLIIIYVIGYIWLNIRLCFRLGPKRFFSTMWHWFDCIMLFLFTMTIIFWVASLADIIANNEIDLPRKYWNALDPELIAEGFFAAAVIMAFFRLNMFLSLNYHLGPLQVSIGKMTLDIFRFILIFCIIILAWCAGLCRFYQPYDGMVQKDAASGSSTTQVSSFVSFSMTLKTFFWAIFGMSPIESADVVIENLPGDSPDTTIINHHEFTEAVGYAAFALFQFLSVVVVLNMLVACMANTFTKVIDNVTVEWVFGRSQIYLSFMAASTLPPPFNLLPTAAGIKNVCVWLKLLVKPSGDRRAKCNVSHCCFIESDTEAYVNSKFPCLMSELAQRYLRIKGECMESHDDVEELKCEMKELLRKMDKITHARKSS